MSSPGQILSQSDQILKAYRLLEEKRMDKDRLMEEVTFVVLDTETTGLDLKRDQLISIGAIKVVGRSVRVSDSLEYLFHYTNQNSRQSDHIAIHEITPETSRREGISVEEGLLNILRFVSNAVLVGHHIDFDLAIIDRYLKTVYGVSLHNKRLDTIHLAKRFYYGNSPRREVDYSLDSLCKEFSISLNARHTAAGDAFITALLFLKLTSLAKQRGVQTIGGLLKKKSWWL